MTLLDTLIFIFGLIWGSFFNVCIVRMPKDESVVWNRSHCPHCQTPIPWYLNIPLFSYLYLRGRCRSCRAKISIQYPLVELSSGLMFLALFQRYGWTLDFLFFAIFCSLLFVISIIDFHHQIIPDELSLSGIVLGSIASFVRGEPSWFDSGLGILLGGGSFLAISYIYEKIAKREGLGGGDVKLLAMIGAWLGYQSILIIIIISSALGSVVGIGAILFQKKDFRAAIPFGPFLALAAILYLIWGPELQQVAFPNSVNVN